MTRDRLLLRRASLLWWLRRATTIETGLFEKQCASLAGPEAAPKSSRTQKVIDSIYGNAIGAKEDRCRDQEEPRVEDGLATANSLAQPTESPVKNADRPER